MRAAVLEVGKDPSAVRSQSRDACGLFSKSLALMSPISGRRGDDSADNRPGAIRVWPHTRGLEWRDGLLSLM